VRHVEDHHKKMNEGDSVHTVYVLYSTGHTTINAGSQTVEHRGAAPTMAITPDAPDGTRGNNCQPLRLKRVQLPCGKQAAGSARREEPGGHTGKADWCGWQQVSSKVTANEECV
jgi:hypothetical protein